MAQNFQNEGFNYGYNLSKFCIQYKEKGFKEQIKPFYNTEHILLDLKSEYIIIAP